MRNRIYLIGKLLGVLLLASVFLACGGGTTSSNTTTNTGNGGGGGTGNGGGTGGGTGVATLSWTPPTQNTDGSPLTDLTGYKIYYGTTSGTYTKTIPVGVNLTTYIVENLSNATTYYFVITAVNSAVSSKTTAI